MTGALSPVIALSSTDAMPTTISPSLGMNSPASTRTTSPLRRSALATLVKRARRGSKPPFRGARSSFRAMMSRRALRSASACALPRPSAIASAKLANSTVNQSQSEIARMKPAGASPWPSERLDEEHRRQHAADQHDEHHGVLDLVARVELRERRRDGAAHDLGVEEGTGLGVGLHRCPRFTRSASGARRSGRAPGPGMKVSAPTMITTPISMTTKSGVCVGSVPGLDRHALLLRERAGDGERRDGEPEAREEHLDAAERVVEGDVRREPGERAAVVPGLRAEGVEDLAEAVRAGVRAPGEPGRRSRRRAR